MTVKQVAVKYSPGKCTVALLSIKSVSVRYSTVQYSTVQYSTVHDVLVNFPDLLKRQMTIFTILLKYSPQHVSALALFTCAGLLSKFLPPQGTKAWFGSSLSQMSHIHFH